MKELILKLVVAGGVMGMMDAFWLMVAMKKFYRDEIGKLLLDKPNMNAALLFYVIYVVGVVVFVITPALEKDSWQHALGYGAFFGFVAYATYDLTNMATLKGFSWKLVAYDLAWGAFLTATMSVVTYFVVKALI